MSDLPHLEPKLSRLFRLLRAHPGGCSEYRLLELLRGAAPLQGLGELELFQVHFLLFHHLHQLKAALEAQGCGTLEIHCLCVRWLPLGWQHPNPEQLPVAADPLAAYYLDLDHLARTTDRDVRELLAGFWRRYRVYDRREAALAALDLSPKASAAEIRSRYRALVRHHHPDRGGDAQRFQGVVEAMEVLRILGVGE